MLAIETVAVRGAGERGTACAVLAALAGCAVRVHDAGELLAFAADAVRHRVDLALSQGTLTRTDLQRILDGVLYTGDLDEALTGSDLVVDTGEAAPPLDRLAEDLRATSAIAAAGATSAPELAARLPQPGRVLALRLEETGGAVPRLEIEPAPGTSVHVVERARAFALRVNRAAHLPGARAP